MATMICDQQYDVIDRTRAKILMAQLFLQRGRGTELLHTGNTSTQLYTLFFLALYDTQ